MIQYDTDGVTLFYIDASGNKVSHNPFDGDAYYQMVVIEQAQKQAASDNNAEAADYHNKLANAQIAINNFQTGVVVPPKPLMKLVDDLGNVTMVPFVPPLPDPTFPVASGSTSIKSAPAPDRTDVLINIVMVMNGKLDKIIAKLGA
jgi:hypothetical protein